MNKHRIFDLADVRQLARHLRRSIDTVSMGGTVGEMGRRTSASTWELEDENQDGHVWVTVGGTVLSALKGNTALISGLPVYVKQTPGGTWKVTGVVDEMAVDYTGDAECNVGPHSHRLGRGYDDYVERRRVEGGLVYPAADPDLTVRVDAFTYRYGDTDYYFEASSIDLSSYVPAAAQSHRWVKVGLDPSTGTLVAAAASSVNQLVDLDVDDLADIAFGDYIPLAGVQLSTDQTEIVYENLFEDFRLLSHWPGGADLSYTPADLDNWSGATPDDVAEALDTLASLCNDLMDMVMFEAMVARDELYNYIING